MHGLVHEFACLAELHFLDRQGGYLAPAALDEAARPAVTDADWAVALSAMREVLTRASDARIVLGRRAEGYKGRIPGIVEEALTALEAGQPLFLLGGFGGCARDIAIALKLLPQPASVPSWSGWYAFGQLNGAALRNGLSAEENATLFRTVHVDEAVALILRGLLRLAKPAQGNA